MSTDERMDAQLREAGARWREDNADAVDVDFAALGAVTDEDLIPITPAAPETRRGQRRAVWLASAIGLAAAVVAALLVLRPGASDDAPRPADGTAALLGVDWRLSAMTDAKGDPLVVVEPAPLRFAKDSVDATDGCNRIGGRATVRGDEIELGPLAATQMACVDRPAGFDAEVAHIAAVLSGTVRWSVSGDALTLTGPAGTLVYRPFLPAPAPTTLVGPTWDVVELGTTAGGVTSSVTHAGVSLTFSADGSFLGTVGCRAVGGTSRIEPDRLLQASVTLREPVTTCPSGAEAKAVQAYTEEFVATLLDGTVPWSVADGRLTLGDGRTGRMVLEPAPAPNCLDGADPAAVARLGGDGTSAAPSRTSTDVTVRVGQYVQVEVDLPDRAVASPAAEGDALEVRCGSQTDGGQTSTTFRAVRPGVVRVTARTDDSGAPMTFTARVTVLAN